MRIQSLLIANRGEIAVRIIRAAKALGIRTVQAYSDADQDSLAVQLADDAVHVGAPRAVASYLNIETILRVALEKKVDAIHPGYGFLSENAEFADAVVQAGLIFIGPSGETIRALGDKANATILARKAGVPTVPGSEGVLGSVEEAVSLCERIGYPVMIKASAGGGGKGIRMAENETALRQLFTQASNEARAVFGNGDVYIEKYIARAKHIEVQLLGDGERCIHLYERECSLQRRRQKVWEEAPCLSLSEENRRVLCESALALAQSVRYAGAGTAEFIYDVDNQQFYFIEMNTRIQVEHPITEMITGVDLVKEMIKVAGGLPLSIHQDEVRIHGHAIECRINAEDPEKGFAPSPGLVQRLEVPQGEGVRFDTFLYEGYRIPVFYDSLVGKLVVAGKTRTEAISKMRQMLSALHIEGIKTTIPLHLRLTETPSVLQNDVTTTWLETFLG